MQKIMKNSLKKYDHAYDTYYSYLYDKGKLKITWGHELFLCDICDRMFEEKYYSILNKCKDVDICYICGDSNKYIDYNYNE